MQTVHMVTISTSISLVVSLILWKYIAPSLPYAVVSVTASFFLLLFLFQLRFLSHMTVAVWSTMWGTFAPLLTGSIFPLSIMPLFLLLPISFFLIVGIGIWAAYRFYPLLIDKRLHKSRFARFDEMETLLARKPLKDSLILGSVKQFFIFRRYICIRPTKVRQEIGHTLVIAPSGTGKTTMIRSQIAILDATSVIITDPKGELFKETAGDRAKKGDVYVLDPTRGVGHCYDPLSGVHTEEAYRAIAEILTFEPHNNDPYWTKSASRKIACLFEASRIENIPPFLYLRCMSRLGLSRVANRLQSLDPELATLFLEEDFTEAKPTDDRTLKGVWSTLTTYIDPVITKTLVRCFTRSDFTAETILRSARPTTLYLRLSEEHLERLSPFVRLVIASLWKGMVATWNRYQGKGCRNVFVFHDEGGIFPLPNLDGFVSTARSKGITYNGYYQSTGQLEDIYGREKARTIRQNMVNSVFLKPNDTDDSERIEAKLGRGSKFADSLNMRQGNDVFSESLSEQAIPVMTARELEEMNEDHTIIFHGNYKPIKAYRLKWWQCHMLKSRQGLTPPVLPELPSLSDLPTTFPQATGDISSHDWYIDAGEILKERNKQTPEKTRR